MRRTYATVPLTRADDAKAQSQEAAIVSVFEREPDRALSPSEVHRGLISSAPDEPERDRWRRTPATSIRRAMTNLTDAGRLRKTDDLVTGPFGRPEHRWELVPAGVPTQRSLFT